MQILSFANKIRPRYIPCIPLNVNPDLSFTFMKGKKKKKPFHKTGLYRYVRSRTAL